jgi:hypothetical protein
LHVCSLLFFPRVIFKDQNIIIFGRGIFFTSQSHRKLRPRSVIRLVHCSHMCITMTYRRWRWIFYSLCMYVYNVAHFLYVLIAHCYVTYVKNYILIENEDFELGLRKNKYKNNKNSILLKLFYYRHIIYLEEENVSI